MKHMFWLDMEMTGLKPESDKILELAVIITDLNLQVVDSFQTAVFQTPETLDGMDAWCKEHHGKSGLTARVPQGISEAEAEARLLSMVETYYSSNDKVVLCGNSIWQDRRFVERYFPKFTAKLHYRMLDVSAWKLVFETMYNKKFKKQEKHLALDDIQESIAEFKYYKGFISL